MRLLLVEDDTMLGSAIQSGLKQAGYTTEWVKDGDNAEHAIATNNFDLLILDINLPGISGLDLLKNIRNKNNHTPVLMLTAMDTLEYKVNGFNLGADDYVVKPFDLDELIVRINAIIRRSKGRSNDIITIGDVELNINANSVKLKNTPIILTAKELKLLTYMMQNRGRILNKKTIEEMLYGWDEEFESNTVEVTIYNLRKKLGKDFINTIRGVGYKIS